ncbi:unnamed protein product [Calypogeia fissa]
MKWILEQNAKGLQVKDHYISKMALKLLEQLRTTEDNPDENGDNPKLLNVAMNKSYQFDYGTRYDQYLAEALTNVDMQTKARNPRVPLVKLVSEWALDWIKHCKEEYIAKAFKWVALYGHVLLESNRECPELIVDSPAWYCPEEEDYSLFCCLLCYKGVRGSDVDASLHAYVMKIVLHMATLQELEDIFNDYDAAD